MRYKKFRCKKMGAALSLMSLSALLAACDVITAQHIPSLTTTAYNNGAGLGGRGAQMGMPGSFMDGGGWGGAIDGVVDEAFDADFVGRIVQVNGSSVELERVEQRPADEKKSGHAAGKAADVQTGWTAAGEALTLTLGSEVKISSGSARGAKQPEVFSGGTTADLRKGQIILVWYKAESKTADRIRILQNTGE